MLVLHQSLRTWVPWQLEQSPGKRDSAFRLVGAKDFVIEPAEDEEAIAVVARMARSERGVQRLAELVVRHRKAAAAAETKYEAALDKLGEAQAAAAVAKRFADTMLGVMWDELQQLAQTDLGLSASRRLLFDRLLTQKMKDRWRPFSC